MPEVGSDRRREAARPVQQHASQPPPQRQACSSHPFEKAQRGKLPVHQRAPPPPPQRQARSQQRGAQAQRCRLSIQQRPPCHRLRASPEVGSERCIKQNPDPAAPPHTHLLRARPEKVVGFKFEEAKKTKFFCSNAPIPTASAPGSKSTARGAEKQTDSPAARLTASAFAPGPKSVGRGEWLSSWRSIQAQLWRVGRV